MHIDVGRRAEILVTAPVLDLFQIPSHLRQKRNARVAKLMKRDLRPSELLCELAERSCNIVRVVLAAVLPGEDITGLVLVRVAEEGGILFLFAPELQETSLCRRKEAERTFPCRGLRGLALVNGRHADDGPSHRDAVILEINGIPLEAEQLRAPEAVVSSHKGHRREAGIRFFKEMDKLRRFLPRQEKKIVRVIPVLLSVNPDVNDRVDLDETVNDCLTENRIENAFIASRPSDGKRLSLTGLLVAFAVSEAPLEIDVQIPRCHAAELQFSWLKVFPDAADTCAVALVGRLFDLAFLAFQPKVDIVAEQDIRVDPRVGKRFGLQIGKLFQETLDHILSAALVILYLQAGADCFDLPLAGIRIFIAQVHIVILLVLSCLFDNERARHSSPF